MQVVFFSDDNDLENLGLNSDMARMILKLPASPEILSSMVDLIFSG